MDKPDNVQPGDRMLTARDVFATHANEWGYVHEVFDDGVALHFPINPTGFEFWEWGELESHSPKSTGVYEI